MDSHPLPLVFSARPPFGLDLIFVLFISTHLVLGWGFSMVMIVAVVAVGAVDGAITVHAVVVGATVASTFYALSLPLPCCLDLTSSCMCYHTPGNEGKMKVVT